MEVTLIHMDNFSKLRVNLYRNLSALSRHFPSGVPVRAMGYMPAKGNYGRKTPEELIFMFVLKGTGRCRCGERAQPVQAPFVIVGYPGFYLEYGPWAGKTWEVFYFNYEPEVAAALEARSLLSSKRLLWPIHNIGLIRRKILELLDAMEAADDLGGVDRIDRMAEGLLVESLIGSALPPGGRQERILVGIRAFLEQHYREPVDVEALALEQGLSSSNFRRLWASRVHAPPAQFVAHLRIREACRLLTETKKSIREIAQTVGYDDPLYFSRRFHQITGERPSSFRSRSGSAEME